MAAPAHLPELAGDALCHTAPPHTPSSHPVDTHSPPHTALSPQTHACCPSACPPSVAAPVRTALLPPNPTALSLGHPGARAFFSPVPRTHPHPFAYGARSSPAPARAPCCAGPGAAGDRATLAPGGGDTRQSRGDQRWALVQAGLQQQELGKEGKEERKARGEPHVSQTMQVRKGRRSRKMRMERKTRTRCPAVLPAGSIAGAGWQGTVHTRVSATADGSYRLCSGEISSSWQGRGGARGGCSSGKRGPGNQRRGGVSAACACFGGANCEGRRALQSGGIRTNGCKWDAGSSPVYQCTRVPACPAPSCCPHSASTSSRLLVPDERSSPPSGVPAQSKARARLGSYNPSPAM